MDIKIFVSADVTSCAQLRIKRSENNRYAFECGIDMASENTFTSNYPPVYGATFVSLATHIMQWKRDIDKRRVSDIESLLICDDSEACVITPYSCDNEDEWEAYHAEVEEKKQSNKEKLAGNKHAFEGLTWNEQENRWEGIISL